MDVIEIDAASNRGINEMRELRENVRYQPARDKYKIFIVDEAHQITSEAFNALLKTIEEPPEWAVFILCTTETHKIPATIASRCQHFSFRSVDFNDLIDRMREICVQEGVEADDEALSVIAQSGEGSVRDSLSALDQAIACCGNKLDADQVRALLGAFSLDAMAQVSTALSNADGGAALALVDELERNGGSPQHFSRELSRYVRNLLVTKISGADSRLVTASPSERAQMAQIAASFSEEDLTRYLQLSLDLFRDLQFSLQPRFHLEIGLLKMIQAGKLVSIEEALASMGSQPQVSRTRADCREASAATASSGGAGTAYGSVSVRDGSAEESFRTAVACGSGRECSAFRYRRLAHKTAHRDDGNRTRVLSRRDRTVGSEACEQRTSDHRAEAVSAGPGYRRNPNSA